MKIASTIARLLLGLMFTVFGANGFLHFLSMPPPPPLAGRFFGVLAESHYMVPVFAIQLIGGVLLLSGFYVPLALACLAPIVVNILLYHVLMDPAGLPPALFAAILWAVAFLGVRSSFAPLFRAKPIEEGA